MANPFAPIFNYPNNKLYQYEAYPVLLSCNFIVDSTNGNGFGIRSLKGAGIATVFMHTSATPGTTQYGTVNPNPATGVILLTLQNNFNRYLGGFSGQVSPVSGTPLTSVTQHTAYVITSLGTTTAAQFQAKGFPSNFVPSVGAAFVATATGSLGGTGTVEATSSSGIDHIEVIGDPNATSQSSNMYAQGGMQIVMQALLNGTPTAPADGTTVSLSFYLSNSSVAVSGQ
jgi:hypothetical protein